MVKNLKSNKHVRGFLDKVKLVAVSIPLGLALTTGVYTGLEVHKSSKLLDKLSEASIETDNPKSKQGLVDSIKEEINTIYSQTFHPSMGSHRIYVSQKPFSGTATYDPHVDRIYVPIMFTPSDLIHEGAHAEWKKLIDEERKERERLPNIIPSGANYAKDERLIPDEIKMLSEMYEEYKRTVLSKERKMQENSNRKKSNKHVYRFQGFLLPGEQTGGETLTGEEIGEKSKKLLESKFSEEVFARITEKYMSQPVLTEAVSKTQEWKEGHQDFKDIFRAYYDKKYPQTEEKIEPREIRVISSWKDYPYAFCSNFKKIFYDFTLGPARIKHKE